MALDVNKIIMQSLGEVVLSENVITERKEVRLGAALWRVSIGPVWLLRSK